MTAILNPRTVALAALFAALVPAAPLPAQDALTLAQAVTRALEHNPDLAADTPAREAAASDLAVAKAGYLPRLDFEQSFTGGDNPVYVFGTLLTQHAFTAANFALPSLNSPDPLKNLQTRFSAQQSIWDGGRTRERAAAARIGVEMSDLGHGEHVRQVLLETVDAYYSVSLARDAWEASRTALESAEAIAKQAQERVQSGLAVEADVLRSQAFLSSARQREIEARGQLDMARSRLSRVMGDPLEAVPGETAPLKSAQVPIPSEEALRAEQRKKRSDYQQMLAAVQQAELEVRARQVEYLPSVGAFASWESDNPSLTRSGGNNWSAGISLRWNIFAGGSDAARVQAARHRLEQKRRELAAMETAMALEIHNALIQYRSAEQQVDVSRAGEAQAQEGLRILRNRYDAGLATMTDLLSAEAQRAAARTGLSQAIYRQRLSVARIDYAAGTLSPSSIAMIP